MIEFAYPIVLYLGIPLILIIFFWRIFYYKKPIYIFSSALPIENAQAVNASWIEYLKDFLRLIALIALCIALSRPRSPDDKSKINVQGIDIILALDISGSMQFFDDLKDQRSRIEVAKQSAINFIDKRENDAIGLVVFASGAVSRSPLTTDKKMLKEILQDTKIGTINPDGTTLSRALLAAINRLKNSDAKSKVIILLTDGEPTVNDVEPQFPVDLAKKLGIKIYTIGVGSTTGGFVNHPYGGIVQVQSRLNAELLEQIASMTGGKFFFAHNAKELEKIYEIIDSLEKKEQTVPVYARYTEYFIYFLIASLILLILEVILSSWWLSL